MSFAVMELPQFLLADNTDYPESVFIIHTDFPRFIYNIVEDEVEWLDNLQGEEDDLVQEIAHLLERAEAFYDREVKRHSEEQ